MKQKSVLAFVLVCLMLFVQMPITTFASETTAETTITLTPGTLPNAAEDISVDQGFYYKHVVDGVEADIKSVNVIDGSLPDGLSFGYIGVQAFDIRGIPEKAGEYNFTIKVTDKEGGEITKDYKWVIDRDIPLAFSTEELSHGYANTAYTNNVSLTKNRTTKNTWELKAVSGETLPSGLTIDESNGKISWSEPVVGKYNLEVKVTRKEKTLSKKFCLIIEPEGGCTHTNAEKIAGKTATCRENGLSPYWYCDDCERNFSDADCENEMWREPSERYTKAFHSDGDGDGKCDTCGKIMPIFKKVTSEDEITSCGMYLLVSKIDGKYYTFKTPQYSWVEKFEAVEITQNADGTFSYPESDTGVMIIETEFAAECGALDAGLPRYSFGTVIDSIPYGIQSSGGIMLDSYSESKYGYRIKLTDEGYAEIASVYSSYWGEKGWEDRVIFSAVTENADDGSTDVSFDLTAPDADRFEIELYKLAYVGTVGETDYTMSDGKSQLTVSGEITVVDSAESIGCSTVGGIGEAVTTNCFEEIISSDEYDITGNVFATTYANINLKSEEVTLNDSNVAEINSLVYNVTPMIEVKGEGDETYTTTIGNDHLDGSEITLTLCVGNMTPKQIIHHKKDKTKEYFYYNKSKDLKPGQKTFSIDYSDNGNFVTFTVTSFSDFEILDTIVTILGDVDGDGSFTATDLATIIRYLANWTGIDEIDETLCDLDGDGNVTNIDGIIGARYLAGWSGYTSLPYSKDE